jgi:hypothetical protein
MSNNVKKIYHTELSPKIMRWMWKVTGPAPDGPLATLTGVRGPS